MSNKEKNMSNKSAYDLYTSMADAFEGSMEEASARGDWGIIKIRQKFKKIDNKSLEPGLFFEVPLKSKIEDEDEDVSLSLLPDSETLECFVLKKRDTRNRWQNVNSSEGPDCFSLNGVTPYNTNKYSDFCAVCPEAYHFRDNPDGKCKSGIDLLIVVPKKVKNEVGKIDVEFLPYILQMSASAIKPTKAFLSMMDYHVHKKLGIPPQFMVTKISVQKAENADYYIPSYPSQKYYDNQVKAINEGKALTGEQLDKIKEIYERLNPVFTVAPGIKGMEALPVTSEYTSLPSIHNMDSESYDTITVDSNDIFVGE